MQVDWSFDQQQPHVLQGKNETFEELVSQFNPKRSPAEIPFPQPAQLRLWILALSHVVSRLERAHSSLVEAIINMPWVTMDNSTVRSYTVFIGMLLSARPEYLSLVLGKLSLGFTYRTPLSFVIEHRAQMPVSSRSQLPGIVNTIRRHRPFGHHLQRIYH